MLGAAEAALAKSLQALILESAHRVAIVEAAERLQRDMHLPDAMLAAGFVRNCVWDHLHQLEPAPHNDVDLIYFDPSRVRPLDDRALERRLSQQMPGIAWEVKNQARMFRRHGDPPYTSAMHAMRFWPEQETAVAIRLDGSRSVVSAFGLKSLFAGVVTVGPHRSQALLLRRASEKRWFDRWNKLRVAQ